MIHLQLTVPQQILDTKILALFLSCSLSHTHKSKAATVLIDFSYLGVKLKKKKKKSRLHKTLKKKYSKQERSLDFLKIEKEINNPTHDLFLLKKFFFAIEP